MSPQPQRLKSLELDPLVKAAALDRISERGWADGEIACFYVSGNGMVRLGQIVRINAAGDWDAYDIQRTEGNGALKIGGPFQGEKAAKKAVEDYWAVIG